MQKALFATLGCAMLLLFASPLRAQVETTPIPLNRKPDLSSMKFLVGTWKCTSTNTRRAVAFTDTVKYTVDPTGYWVVSTDVSDPVSFDPHAHTSVTKTTYDVTTTRWVSLMTDEQGNYDMSSSSGWKGNKLVWHDMAYPKSAYISSSGDTTLVKVSPTKTTSTYTFGEPSGRTVTGKTVCTKR